MTEKIWFPLVFFTRWISKSWKVPHWRVFCFHDVPDRESFETFLNYFAKWYTYVPFTNGVQAIMNGRVSTTIASLRFDDGFLSQFEHALPVLHQLGYSGILGVVPKYVDAGRLIGNRVPDPAMNWTMVKIWQEHGNELANHSFSHRRLVECSAEEIENEAITAAREIHKNTGTWTLDFIYPHGRFSPFTQRILTNLGFATQSTIVRGKMNSNHPTDRIHGDQVDLTRPLLKTEIILRLGELSPRLRKAALALKRVAHKRLKDPRHDPRVT